MRLTGRSYRRSCILALFLACVSGADAKGQSIRGVVRDSATSLPLGGARVTLIRAPNAPVTSATTDSAGRFVLTFERSGSGRLEVQRLGYVPLVTAPLVLTPAEILQVELTLTPAPIALEPIAATATVQSWNLSQFRERQRAGWGRYLGPEQIAALPPRTGIQAVLRVGGGRFLADDRGNGLLMRSVNTVKAAYCVPRVFIDGTEQLPLVGRGLPGSRRPPGFNIDAILPPASIRGVEVYYRPSDAPYHKALESECGIVMFWTARGLGIR